jgi:hypothetical protein
MEASPPLYSAGGNNLSTTKCFVEKKQGIVPAVYYLIATVGEIAEI